MKQLFEKLFVLRRTGYEAVIFVLQCLKPPGNTRNDSYVIQFLNTIELYFSGMQVIYIIALSGPLFKHQILSFTEYLVRNASQNYVLYTGILWNTEYPHTERNMYLLLTARDLQSNIHHAFIKSKYSKSANFLVIAVAYKLQSQAHQVFDL